MGRAPCCDKASVKKGPWSPEEDAKLKDYIDKNGTGGNWIALPQKIGLKRCGKSCRLRWLNYLRPNIKHGGFSEEEDDIICSLYISIGSRWSIIAAQLPGRTDNDIKNYWNTRLKKKFLGKQRKEQQARRSIKQELMKRSAGSHDYDNHHDQNIYMVNPAANSGSMIMMNQTLFWPDPAQLPLVNNNINISPVLHPNPSPDQAASIKNLLIKLGGRFSDHQQDGDHHHHHHHHHHHQQPIIQEAKSSSPSCTSSTTITAADLQKMQVAFNYQHVNNNNNNSSVLMPDQEQVMNGSWWGMNVGMSSSSTISVPNTEYVNAIGSVTGDDEEEDMLESLLSEMGMYSNVQQVGMRNDYTEMVKNNGSSSSSAESSGWRSSQLVNYSDLQTGYEWQEESNMRGGVQDGTFQDSAYNFGPH